MKCPIASDGWKSDYLQNGRFLLPLAPIAGNRVDEGETAVDRDAVALKKRERGRYDFIRTIAGAKMVAHCPGIPAGAWSCYLQARQQPVAASLIVYGYLD